MFFHVPACVLIFLRAASLECHCTFNFHRVSTEVSFLMCTDTMVGWVMKAFNVSHFDDRRLCYTTSCDSRMVVYHWGRAIKAAMSTEATSDEKESSVCCPTREQCSPQHARTHLLAVQCVDRLHGGDPQCAGPTLGLNNELDLILEVDRHHHMRSDWQWVTSHPVHNSALQTVDSD